MIEIDFTTTCVVQMVIYHHDHSESPYTYLRPATLTLDELILDAMDYFDVIKKDSWWFISSILIARNEDDYYGPCTLNDEPEPTIDELHS